MNVTRTACVTVFLVIAAPAGLLAQDDPGVSPGDKVFVWTTSDDRIRGKVLELDADTLILAVHNGERHISLSSSKWLEKSLGVNESRMAAGALIGLALGAVVTVGIWAGICSADYGLGTGTSSSGECFSENAPPYIIGAGVLGGVIGAVIGYEDRWEKVKLDKIRVGLSPHTADGVAVSVSLRQ